MTPVGDSLSALWPSCRALELLLQLRNVKPYLSISTTLPLLVLNTHHSLNNSLYLHKLRDLWNTKPHQNLFRISFFFLRGWSKDTLPLLDFLTLPVPCSHQSVKTKAVVEIFCVFCCWSWKAHVGAHSAVEVLNFLRVLHESHVFSQRKKVQVALATFYTRAISRECILNARQVFLQQPVAESKMTHSQHWVLIRKQKMDLHFVKGLDCLPKPDVWRVRRIRG